MHIDFPYVVPRDEFRNVTLQMLLAHLMERALVSTFQHGPKRLYAIGMDVFLSNAFPFAVANSLVYECTIQAVVRLCFVRVDRCARFRMVKH